MLLRVCFFPIWTAWIEFYFEFCISFKDCWHTGKGLRKYVEVVNARKMSFFYSWNMSLMSNDYWFVGRKMHKKYQDLTDILTRISLTFSRKITNIIYFSARAFNNGTDSITASVCLSILILVLVSYVCPLSYSIVHIFNCKQVKWYFIKDYTKKYTHKKNPKLSFYKLIYWRKTKFNLQQNPSLFHLTHQSGEKMLLFIPFT